jgi:hypothetical protein
MDITHELQVVLRTDTYGSIDEESPDYGVAAVSASTMRGNETLDSVFIRLPKPAPGRFGQAFCSMEHFAQFARDVRELDEDTASTTITDFYNKWRQQVDVYVDAACQHHSVPLPVMEPGI